MMFVVHPLASFVGRGEYEKGLSDQKEKRRQEINKVPANI
jgi:hypothetical protein